MFDIRDLQTIKILNYLDYPMLEKIAAITEIENFKTDQYIYKEGDTATKIFGIIDGSVILEMPLNPSTVFQIKQITKRQSFGISALVDDEKKHISHARARTTVRAYVWNIADLEKLLESDHELGFHFMKSISVTITNRLGIKMANH